VSIKEMDMGYERTPRDRFRDNDDMDYGRDYGSGRDYTYSSARDYAAAGYRDREDAPRGGGYRRDGGRFDQRPYGGYGGRESQSGYDSDRYQQTGDHGRGGRYGAQNQRFNRPPPGYDQDDRGFFARAGDEVRSWFGDEEAERRREFDSRYDDRYGSNSDRDYSEWRRSQMSQLDRDYDEYRRENQQKFHNEFGSWRAERQGQRSLLEKVTEHMEVTGSDGQHVGTVDKVRGDRIILTKSDADAGGHHHSIPSRWIRSVDDKVTISKSAEEAQREWKDEERRTAMFNDDYRERDSGPHMLNRSFSGTYR
jgi:hypothetical protein